MLRRLDRFQRLVRRDFRLRPSLGVEHMLDGWLVGSSERSLRFEVGCLLGKCISAQSKKAWKEKKNF